MEPRIIKFRHNNIDDQQEAIDDWLAGGVSVPKIISSGIVPLATQGKPVKYLIMEAVIDQEGALAVSGSQYNKDPEVLVRLGIAMVKELAIIHQTKSNRGFGGIADMFGETSQDSWAHYLEKTFLRYYHDTLKDKYSVSEQEMEAVLRAIISVEFPTTHSYLHGDFGVHNVLVQNEETTEIKIIDPNPRIGDPYFDLGIQKGCCSFASI